jgi:predicted transcriptional regulator
MDIEKLQQISENEYPDIVDTVIIKDENELRNGYEITYNGLLVLLPFNFLEKVLK